jgi:hypothetical protein
MKHRAVGLLLRTSFIIALLAAPLSAGAPKKVSGQIGDATVRARTELFLAENPADTGHLVSVSRTLTSLDPAWNGAHIFSVRFSDPFMRQERRSHGHMVITHPNGDQTFVEYQLRWKGLDWETSGHFVGGTGRFSGITGKWRVRGTPTPTSDAGQWEAEYELP